MKVKSVISDDEIYATTESNKDKLEGSDKPQKNRSFDDSYSSSVYSSSNQANESVTEHCTAVDPDK